MPASIAGVKAEPNAYLIVLLGGEAGLRCGEMMALEWPDVDLGKRQLCVQRSEWKGHVTVPKGGRLRYVPMTVRLASALREHRHLRGPRVVCQRNGAPLSADVVKHHVERAARRAQLTTNGVHRLRHTFCSHLAMRGAPARAIQELAGHQDLTTTQRYMHLSPAAIEGAIRLLDHRRSAYGRGDLGETKSTASDYSNH
jgi:integrase